VYASLQQKIWRCHANKEGAPSVQKMTRGPYMISAFLSKKKATIAGVNVLVVSLFPHMITIPAAVFVFHLKHLCTGRGEITKACLGNRFSSEEPPAAGTPTAENRRRGKISENEDCQDDESPYFHRSLPTTLSMVFLGRLFVGFLWFAPQSLVRFFDVAVSPVHRRFA
jgi:hypothetical protein